MPILPEGMTASPVDHAVHIRVQGFPLLGLVSDVGRLQEYNNTSHLEPGQVLHGALAVLNDVQEVAVRFLGRTWPMDSETLWTATGRVEDRLVLLWFGNRASPVLTFEPLRV
jgi:hypothetical protein